MYSVDPNSSPASRVGAITINGLAYTVTEGGTINTASGRVITSSGQGLAGVTITFSAGSPYLGLPGPVVTDANGYWSQSGFLDCKNHFATASKSGYTFSPFRNFFSPGATNLDFVATQQGSQAIPSGHQRSGDETVALVLDRDRPGQGKADEGASVSSGRIIRPASSVGVGVFSCLFLFLAIRRYGIRSSARRKPPA